MGATKPNDDRARLNRIAEKMQRCNRLADEATRLLGEHINDLTRRLPDRQDREHGGDAQQSA